MRYILPLLKAVLTICVFFIAFFAAKDPFQIIVAAGIGYTYSIANMGTSTIRLQNTAHMITMMRCFNSYSKSIPGCKEGINLELPWNNLDEAERKLQQREIDVGIDIFSNILVIVGSTYFVFMSMN